MSDEPAKIHRRSGGWIPEDGETPDAVDSRPKSPEKNVPHIMFSYDHDHKEQVWMLESAIKKMGYKTWIDKDKMRK
jgi:hypothetical protein